MRKRIVSILTYNKGCLFRTKQFVPDYQYTSNFLDFWSIDEIIALDITRKVNESRELYYEAITKIAQNCFVPLAAGGGIKTIEDVDKLFDLGADKIVLNTIALEQPKFIGEVAKKYGVQAVVVSIDARQEGDKYYIYKQGGQIRTDFQPAEWAQQAVKEGAGEILITSIEEDGSLNGYDKDLCSCVVNSVRAPVLIAGGAGNWKHFEQGFCEIGASAVCTTNIYHFTEKSILNAKNYLRQKNVDVRD